MSPLKKMRIMRWLRGLLDFAIDSFVMVTATIGLVLGLPSFILIVIAYSVNQSSLRRRRL